MKAIASTDFYSIAVDPAKNRLFLSIKGDWLKEKDVADLLADFEAGVGQCSPGYTTLVDLTEMGQQALPDVHEKAMGICIGGGVKKVAEIYDRESFAKIQMERAGERTGLPVKRCTDRREGEAWLDE